MDLESKYNTKIPAVKRLMREACELREPTEHYSAYPLQDNLFEWHFTVKGACGTEFEGGVYHGRIIFPNEYPMKPPNIILLTPNGRFEINKKICLSISGHHPETWQPSWSIRTALMALIAFMPTEAKGTLGSLDYTPEERQVLARKSQRWSCTECGLIIDKLGQNAADMSQAESNMVKSVQFKAEGAGSISKASTSQETNSKENESISSQASPPPSTAPSSQSGNAGDNQQQFSTQHVDSPMDHSGFFIDRRIADFLIAAIVFLLAFLAFRRFA